MNILKIILISLLSVPFIGCVKKQDYTAYRAAAPRSIIVLPVINHSNNPLASKAAYVTAIEPLIISGYYVYPSFLVSESLKQAGFISPEMVAKIPTSTLFDIFKADSGLYLTVESYGHQHPFTTITSVKLSGKLVNLKTGEILWTGQADAHSTEYNPAIVYGTAASIQYSLFREILTYKYDHTIPLISLANFRLLLADNNDRGSLLFGPYHELVNRRILVTSNLQVP